MNNNRIYGIASLSKKGTICLKDGNGKFMFPLNTCKHLKPGPVVIYNTVDKGNFFHFFGKQYKMSLPTDADLLKYLSTNVQFGNIVEMFDEEYGSFYVAPNGDVLTKDEKGRLCIIGKGSRLERRNGVVKKIDIAAFLMKKKFGCSYEDIRVKFEMYFKQAQSCDENVDFSHLTEVENQILRPRKTKSGVYYYAFNDFVFERNLPFLSKEDLSYLVNEFNSFNTKANYQMT